MAIMFRLTMMVMIWISPSFASEIEPVEGILRYHNSPWLQDEFIRDPALLSLMTTTTTPPPTTQVPINMTMDWTDFDYLDVNCENEEACNRCNQPYQPSMHCERNILERHHQREMQNHFGYDRFNVSEFLMKIQQDNAQTPNNVQKQASGQFRQCPYLREAIIEEMCQSDMRPLRKELLKHLHLRACRRFLVERTLSKHLYSLVINTTDCAAVLNELLLLDNVVNDLACEYESILYRYDCQAKWSVVWTCKDCKLAYRDWLCSMIIPYHRDGGQLIKPCQSVCEQVQQKCPHLHPYGKGQYAGEPVFLCMDPNIPFNKKITPEIPFGDEDQCYNVCDLQPCLNEQHEQTTLMCEAKVFRSEPVPPSVGDVDNSKSGEWGPESGQFPPTQPMDYHLVDDLDGDLIDQWNNNYSVDSVSGLDDNYVDTLDNFDYNGEDFNLDDTLLPPLDMINPGQDGQEGTTEFSILSTSDGDVEPPEIDIGDNFDDGNSAGTTQATGTDIPLATASANGASRWMISSAGGGDDYIITSIRELNSNANPIHPGLKQTQSLQFVDIDQSLPRQINEGQASVSSSSSSAAAAAAAAPSPLPTITNNGGHHQHGSRSITKKATGTTIVPTEDSSSYTISSGSMVMVDSDNGEPQTEPSTIDPQTYMQDIYREQLASTTQDTFESMVLHDDNDDDDIDVVEDAAAVAELNKDTVILMIKDVDGLHDSVKTMAPPIPESSSSSSFSSSSSKHEESSEPNTNVPKLTTIYTTINTAANTMASDFTEMVETLPPSSTDDIPGMDSATTIAETTSTTTSMPISKATSAKRASTVMAMDRKPKDQMVHTLKKPYNKKHSSINEAENVSGNRFRHFNSRNKKDNVGNVIGNGQQHFDKTLLANNKKDAGQHHQQQQQQQQQQPKYQHPPETPLLLRYPQDTSSMIQSTDQQVINKNQSRNTISMLYLLIIFIFLMII